MQEYHATLHQHTEEFEGAFEAFGDPLRLVLDEDGVPTDKFMKRVKPGQAIALGVVLGMRAAHSILMQQMDEEGDLIKVIGGDGKKVGIHGLSDLPQEVKDALIEALKGEK